MTPQMKHSNSQKDTTDAAACWEGQTCLSSITARTCPAPARVRQSQQQHLPGELRACSTSSSGRSGRQAEMEQLSQVGLPGYRL